MWKKFVAALFITGIAIGPVIFLIQTLAARGLFDIENSSGLRYSGSGLFIVPIFSGFILALLFRALPWTRSFFSVTSNEATAMYGFGVMIVAVGGLFVLCGILSSGIYSGTVLDAAPYSGAILFLFGLSYIGASFGMSPALKIE